MAGDIASLEGNPANPGSHGVGHLTGTTEHCTASLPLRRPRPVRGTAPGDRDQAPSAAITAKPTLAQPLSMPSNAVWNFLGNVVYAASRWAMVVVLAKLGNSEMVGLVILAFALGAPWYSLTNLGLRNALVTDVRREYGFQDYLGLRLILAAIAVLLVGVMVWGLGYEAELVWLALLAGAGRFFESISDIFHGLLQRQERMDRIAIAMMVREPAAVLFLAAVVCLTGSLVWGMVGFPLAMAATLLLYDIPNGVRLLKASAAGPANDCRPIRSDQLAPRWRPHTMLRLTWLCVPLGVVMTMVTLIVNIPRYTVEHYLGSGALGIFASITYISTAAVTLVAAIGQSASPRLAKHYAARETAAYCVLVGKLLVMVGVVGFGLAGLMAVAGGPILQLLYGPKFAGYTTLAVYLMLASALNNLCGPLGRAVDATRQFWTHMFIRVAGILVLLGLVPVLVQGYGLEGAAAAVFLSTGFSILLYVSVIAVALMRLRKDKP